jgi:hypothetical protein
VPQRCLAMPSAQKWRWCGTARRANAEIWRGQLGAPLTDVLGHLLVGLVLENLGLEAAVGTASFSARSAKPNPGIRPHSTEYSSRGSRRGRGALSTSESVRGHLVPCSLFMAVCAPSQNGKFLTSGPLRAGQDRRQSTGRGKMSASCRMCSSKRGSMSCLGGVDGQYACSRGTYRSTWSRLAQS